MKTSSIKRNLKVIIILSVFTSCGSGTTPTSTKTEETQSITLLHTNDIHGNYMPFKTNLGSATSQTGDSERDNYLTFEKEAEIGGFAVLATAVKELRNSRGGNNVL